MDDAAPIPVVAPAPFQPPSRPHAPRFYNTLLHALSALGEGVVVMEGERFVFANAAFARMVGLPADVLTGGMSVRSLFAPEARELMEAKLAQRLAGQAREDRYEGTLVHASGARVHVEISVKPIYEDGRSLRFAVLRDITERRRQQEEVDAARKEMARSEKLAALGSLVGGVAHEVRTPLVYIQNSAHVLKREAEALQALAGAPAGSAQRIADSVRSIEEGIDRITSLVRDLHRYARLPAGQFGQERLDEVVGEALHLWGSTHPGTAASITTHLEPVPLAWIDRAKMQQVVLNLVDNASDAMPGGGRVLVSTHALPSAAQLIVRDEGVGMRPEDKARIFEPLFTTKSDGMGLGLDIVRRIVDLHRGTIRCDSSPGEGTTFTLTFPAVAGDEAPDGR